MTGWPLMTHGGRSFIDLLHPRAPIVGWPLAKSKLAKQPAIQPGVMSCKVERRAGGPPLLVGQLHMHVNL